MRGKKLFFKFLNNMLVRDLCNKKGKAEKKKGVENKK
jgi:hypothetical protein